MPHSLGEPLSFRAFFRRGAPVVVLTICISSVYVLALYVLLGFE